MKLYTSQISPSARRVEIFLREKGIAVERIEVDLGKGEQRAPSFLAKNPLGTVPFVELADGTCLAESLAICEYLEETHPEPSLHGKTALERARVREAERVAELGLFMSAEIAFWHDSEFFAKYVAPSKTAADEARQRFGRFSAHADRMLGQHAWLAGPRFTVADITAICAVDFGRFCGCLVPDEHRHVGRWLAAIRQRASCAQ
jgi:glutathione S-transferase